MLGKSIIVLAAAMIGASAGAHAQTKPRHDRPPTATQYYNEAPPLTVNRRSFLDPGPVVPVGSMSNYVTANTVFSRTPDQVYARSYFGNEALPAPLEIPARSSPLIQFSTPRLD